jgi:hypothetical protein
MLLHTDLLLRFTDIEAFVSKECILPDDYPGLQQARKDEGFVGDHLRTAECFLLNSGDSKRRISSLHAD